MPRTAVDVRYVAAKLYELMRINGRTWWLERGTPHWARVKIARPCSCDACGLTIPENEIVALFCLELNFRKVCLAVFHLPCAKQLKKSLVSALWEVHRNGRALDN
jgi:hypothetical protein